MHIDEMVVTLVVRFFLDLLAVTCLVNLYYKRYGEKELVISAALFNLFAFSVLSLLSSVQFGVNAGFGLFAILALFTLRSEQISKIEIAYFFGALALAVISSLQGTNLSFVFAGIILVILSAYVVDHPKILANALSIKVTLDRVDEYNLSDIDRFKAELSRRLHVDVISYQIKNIDYINDSVIVNVNYRKV